MSIFGHENIETTQRGARLEHRQGNSGIEGLSRKWPRYPRSFLREWKSGPSSSGNVTLNLSFCASDAKCYSADVTEFKEQKGSVNKYWRGTARSARRGLVFGEPVSQLLAFQFFFF